MIPSAVEHRARKNYICNYCGKPIEKGTKYIRDAIAPWQQGYFENGQWEWDNSGEWHIGRYHLTASQIDSYEYPVVCWFDKQGVF